MTYEDLPILYVKTDDPRCSDAVAFLDEHGIGYHLRNVSADRAAAAELLRLPASSLVPTLDWHGEVLPGFTTARLATFLREQEVEMEDS